MDYITCTCRKNKPRVSVAVCMKCKRSRNCIDYRDYLQPSLFPDAFERRKIARAIYTRGNKPKRTISEATEILGKPEQLALNL